MRQQNPMHCTPVLGFIDRIELMRSRKQAGASRSHFLYLIGGALTQCNAPYKIGDRTRYFFRLHLYQLISLNATAAY